MKNSLICLLILAGSAAAAQSTCLLKLPTKLTRKSKVETWAFLDDNIYLKLIAAAGNKTSSIYTYTTNGQTRTISEIREYGVFSANWLFKPGDKIEVWEDNTVFADTKVLTYTFTNADKNASVKTVDNPGNKYKLSISKGCIL